MTPQQVIQQAQKGDLATLYLLVGEERFLIDEALVALRAATDTGAAGAAFNEDRFIAGDASVDTVLSAARTAPMMAAQRYVLVSAVERWDAKGKGAEAMDALDAYADDPSPSTVFVMVAQKLNGGRRLMKRAKKAGFLVECTPLARGQLPRWISDKAKAMGHPLDRGLADMLAELLGPELGPVSDALERLSLYVGEGEPIDANAVSQVVTRVRQETVWALVDALAARDLGAALSALDDAYDPRDHGLPLLGAVTWRVRQLIKFDGAMRHGGGTKAAAKAAGVAPFKASELQRTVRGLPGGTLERWLMLLAEADLALKGSRRPGVDVLGTMLVDMCRGPRV